MCTGGSLCGDVSACGSDGNHLDPCALLLGSFPGQLEELRCYPFKIAKARIAGLYILLPLLDGVVWVLAKVSIFAEDGVSLAKLFRSQFFIWNNHVFLL